MRVSSLIAGVLLPIAALAAKKATGDRFDTFYSKSTPFKLDDSSYSKLTAAPRDFSVAVLLTALAPQFGCQLCREVQPEWDLLSKSWTKGDKNAEGRMLFGTLDFVDGKSTFQSLGLQTAPVLLVFPPTSGPHAKPNTGPAKYEFTSGQTAEMIQQFIVRHVPEPHPRIQRPFNWVKLITVTTGILGSITLITVAAPYLGPVLQNRNLWAAISLIAVLLFTSGHMFNHIRGVPYVSGDGKGNINYFAGGFQNQWGLETQIVAAIYGVLAFATISLGLKVPRIADPTTQQIAVFAWAGVMYGMYSFLLYVFKIKNGGYPFSLPPF